MNGFTAALWCETLKLRRSKVAYITLAASMLLPLMGGLFMFILKDPERARSLGMLGNKAQLAGAADWPSYLNLLSLSIAVGGLLIFGLLAIWVFGREFMDRTAKDLLVLPTSRDAIVTAKFVVITLWSALIAALVWCVSMAIGTLLDLPGGSSGLFTDMLVKFMATSGMMVLLVWTFGLAASVTRGYLSAVGVIFLILFASQIAAAIGFGAFFPWAIPAMLSDIGGTGTPLPSYSYLIVLATVGITYGATLVWWRKADQSK